MYRYLFKPLLDFMLALAGLILLSPVFIVTLTWLTVSTRGHPFFIQERPGKNGKLFRLYKFRTMNNKRNRAGELLADHLRVTRTGNFLRNSSLDEIPQLVNVIKGELSLIGPRPLLKQYLPLYNERQARRHDVKPGITGWAQINGRNALSWEEKFEFDLFYVEHLSFRLDLIILIQTISRVFKREGIYAPHRERMKYFKGTMT
jgi:lipopolysaccharide/colanic/teichoic acid biosynthesis glycosyltransferase